MQAPVMARDTLSLAAADRAMRRPEAKATRRLPVTEQAITQVKALAVTPASAKAAEVQLGREPVRVRVAEPELDQALVAARGQDRSRGSRFRAGKMRLQTILTRRSSQSKSRRRMA